MTIRHLRIFLAVCQEKNITAASKRLYISQPAVSLAVKELESYYGVRLLDRFPHRLYLTDAGQSLYQYAMHIVSLFDEMETSLKSRHSSGNLRIGSSLTIGTSLLPGYLKQFSALFPGVKPHVAINSSDIIERMILENELDLALIEGIVHSPDILSEPFQEDELIPVCHPSHPLLQKSEVSLSDLTGESFLMREKNSGTREIVESALLVHEFIPNTLWESTSTPAIIVGVAQGIGISVLPLDLVRGDLNTGRICRFSIQGVRFPRQLHIIRHKSKYLNAPAEGFLTLVRRPSNDLIKHSSSCDDPDCQFRH